MPCVAYTRKIQSLEAVESVFHGMITDMMFIKIEPDGVGITEDVDIFIFFKIDSNKLFEQFGELRCEPDPLYHIGYEVAAILLVFRKLRKKCFSLLIKLDDFLKESRFLYPVFESAEIIGHET